ncbi:Polysaccharide lyase family 8 protein [Mycena chlorophos]|uniref:Polysaccharide lyase family 8 protein n=1 Tax=Mycena chlorophos TaxID=658473 RepID=A0A8H6T4U1_MYCCL|nr:Polysaccharide lyase family 8 protein [Mycena chlorophos]
MSRPPRPPTKRATTSLGGSSGRDVELRRSSANHSSDLDLRLKPTHSSYQKKPTRESLSRHGSLLSPPGAAHCTARRAAELKTILGNANSARLPPRAAVSPHHNGQEFTTLEQAKPRARVELDITLRNNVCVEGGSLCGLIKLRVRRDTSHNSILVSDPKLRIIGLETANGDYHSFYQHAASFAEIGAKIDHIDTKADQEGFFRAREGVHRMNFSMHIPINHGARPRGVVRASGFAVRYIVLVSIKVKDENNQRSIAHFYRDCEIYPRLDPTLVLAPAEKSPKATISQNLGSDSKGVVSLTVGVHRDCFVAGTHIPARIRIRNLNNSKRTIKSLTLALYRTTTLFKRTGEGSSDMHVCHASTPRAVASSTLEMAQGYPRGHASASGWWSGVPPGETVDFSHILLIPADALSYPRGRLVEVGYALKVSLSCGTLSPDISVTLPIRIINFLSLDPPPSLVAAPVEERHSQLSSTLAVSESEGDASAYDSESESCYPAEEGFPEDADSVFPDVVEELVRRSIFAAQVDPQSSSSADENIPPVAAVHEKKSRLGPPAFAQRVQTKLQHVRQSPALEPAVTCSAKDVVDGRPQTQTTLEAVSDYQTATSSFLNEYLDDPPQPVASFKRDIDTPIVGLPFPETPALDVVRTVSPEPASPHEPVPSEDLSETASVVETASQKRPVITTGASANSVKERVKALEERVRAAGGYR